MITQLYVARDKDGSLFLYTSKPTKHEEMWDTRDTFYDLETDSERFSEITWDDDEPKEFELV